MGHMAPRLHPRGDRKCEQGSAFAARRCACMRCNGNSRDFRPLNLVEIRKEPIRERGRHIYTQERYVEVLSRIASVHP